MRLRPLLRFVATLYRRACLTLAALLLLFGWVVGASAEPILLTDNLGLEESLGFQVLHNGIPVGSASSGTVITSVKVDVGTSTWVTPWAIRRPARGRRGIGPRQRPRARPDARPHPDGRRQPPFPTPAPPRRVPPPCDGQPGWRLWTSLALAGSSRDLRSGECQLQRRHRLGRARQRGRAGGVGRLCRLAPPACVSDRDLRAEPLCGRRHGIFWGARVGPGHGAERALWAAVL